jgi:hypothetical protein
MTNTITQDLDGPLDPRLAEQIRVVLRDVLRAELGPVISRIKRLEATLGALLDDVNMHEAQTLNQIDDSMLRAARILAAPPDDGPTSENT